MWNFVTNINVFLCFLIIGIVVLLETTVDNKNKHVNILWWINLCATPAIVLVLWCFYFFFNKFNSSYNPILICVICLYFVVNLYYNIQIDINGESFENSSSGKTSDENLVNQVSDTASKQGKKIAEEMGFSNLPTKTLLYILNYWIIYRLVYWCQSLTCNNNGVTNYSFGIQELLQISHLICNGSNTNSAKETNKGDPSAPPDPSASSDPSAPSFEDNDKQGFTDNGNTNTTRLKINRSDSPHIGDEICGISIERLKIMLVCPFIILFSPFKILSDILGNRNNTNYPFSVDKSGCLNAITYYLFSYILYLFTLLHASNVLICTGSSQSYGLTGLVIGIILFLVFYFGKILDEFFNSLWGQLETDVKKNLTQDDAPMAVGAQPATGVDNCSKCTVKGVEVDGDGAAVLAWVRSKKQVNHENPTPPIATPINLVNANTNTTAKAKEVLYNL